VPPGGARAGSAAALNETGSLLGFALGIAAPGSIGAAVYGAHVARTIPARVPAAVAQAGRDTLASAAAAARNLPRPLATTLLGVARSAFTAGMHVTAAISAVLVAGVAFAVIARLRHVAPYGHAQQATGTQPGPDQPSQPGHARHAGSNDSRSQRL